MSDQEEEVKTPTGWQEQEETKFVPKGSQQGQTVGVDEDEDNFTKLHREDDEEPAIKNSPGGEEHDRDSPDDHKVQAGHGTAADDGEGAEKDDEQHEDDDEDDEEDEEDEEDDEEDEEEEDSGRRRKRARREGRNQFLDVEAEVDEDEEDFEEDEEGLGREDGFIQEEHDEVEDTDDRLHREVDRRREAIAEEDAERLASEYRERYGRSAANKYRGDTGVVPQRLLLPSVQDPNIWGVRCKIGKEKELVRSILKKKTNLQYTKTPLEIFSAFQRDTFTGYIYIEARKQAAVLQALKGFANIYTQNMVLVPIKEYPDMLRVTKTKDLELTPGTYVRIKRGKYAGDLAIVENLSENGLEARLKVVPRLDYGRSVILDSEGKRKRAGGAAGAAKSRPPPRLFSANEATQYDARNLQRRGPNTYFYAGEEYENGYLLKDFKINFLLTESITPRLEELTRFNTATEDGIDLNALAQSLKQAAANTTFQTGEHVEVFKGEQTGMQGQVVSTQSDIVTIVGTGDLLKGQRIDIPVSNLQKKFSVGDHVRVINGNYKDDTGMVVQVQKDKVTFLSDLSKTEVVVFSKDLKSASDIGGSNVIGKYELHDLVKLNAQMVGCIVNIERESVSVLGQDGHLRNVSPSAINMKVAKGGQFATDRNGKEVRIGDTVKELSGERREGTVLHIYGSSVFLHNRQIAENLGVFVTRSSNIGTISTKGMRDENDLNKMNPNMMRPNMPPPPVASGNVSRAKLVGQHVSIGNGSQYKGLKGIIRDINDNLARVELEAKNRIVNIDKTKLLFNDANSGKKLTYMEYAMPRRSGVFGGGAPSYGGGVSSNGGGSTPSWAAGMARTPAWSSSRTPGWAGSKTPAYGGGGGDEWGSRTPAWNTGAKTPAFDGSGRTPAWNAGASTPGWDMDRSSKAADMATPGFYSSTDFSAPTPGFAHTPGALTAPTPGFFREETNIAPTPGAPTPGAPTPAVYDAKTPGIIAQTPAAWGADDSETPRYEAATP
jgi:transcription elongation factor SPT5